MLIEGSSSVFWADVISNEDVDKEIVKTYVNCVNEKSYAELTELFCNEQKEVLSLFFEDSTNEEENRGVYNVVNIKSYELEKIDSSADEYEEFEEVQAYLLYMNCHVEESDQYFKEGDNYFRLVIASENESRVILELSVASNLTLENAVDGDSNLISNVEYEEYLDGRNELLESIDGFELRTSLEEGINANARATYSPKTLSSYSFPTTISIKNTSDGKIYRRNFKNYCYVVVATELACGTDGATTVHTEALKAFSLCVRNLGWYRCIYPYNATAGYDVTDNTATQAYDWSREGLIDSQFSRHKSAVNAVWNVMMFDGAKKLFHPSYRSGSYNSSRNSSQSLFYQNGANYLATVKGYSYAQILHYYYDPAVGNEISSGPIVICSSHSRMLLYTMKLEGHGHPCKTCGHVTLTSHTWVNYNSYYKCSVCGYESTVILAD